MMAVPAACVFFWPVAYVFFLSCRLVFMAGREAGHWLRVGGISKRGGTGRGPFPFGVTDFFLGGLVSNKSTVSYTQFYQLFFIDIYIYLHAFWGALYFFPHHPW